jgi:acetyl-CoA carboxylase alpha subunit
MLENNRLQVVIKNIATMIQNRVLAFLSHHEGKIQQFKQQVSNKTTEFDSDLAQRYPEQYSALKQQANQAKTWYEQQITDQKAHPERPLFIDRNNHQITEQMKQIGQNAAQAEQDIRSRIAAKLRPEEPKA